MYPSAVIFGDLLANRKTNSRTSVLGLSMQSLKDLENLFGVNSFKPNTVVCDFNPEERLIEW